MILSFFGFLDQVAFNKMALNHGLWSDMIFLKATDLPAAADGAKRRLPLGNASAHAGRTGHGGATRDEG